MIDPNSMMGALTGGQQPPTQAAAPQPPTPSPSPAQTAVGQSDPVQGVSTGDSLDLLESIVNETASAQTSSQVVPPVATPAVTANPGMAQDPPAQPAVPLAGEPDVSAQAVISTIQTTEDPLNPLNPAPASAKENFERPAAPDAASLDVGGAVQQVEVERNPEVPIEVEGFLQRVEDFSVQEPQEVVIADGTSEQASTNYSSRPVIVLPISAEDEQKGKNKSPKYSIRWLIEWSHKVIKMFAGKVIYRQVEEEK